MWYNKYPKFYNDDTASLHFDGSCTGKKGRFAFCIADYKTGQEIISAGPIDVPATSNIAEYLALIFGLKKCLDEKLFRVHVYGDSQLVINQLNGEYLVRDEKLKPLYERAVELSYHFSEITFDWVPRKENAVADRLSKPH